MHYFRVTKISLGNFFEFPDNFCLKIRLLGHITQDTGEEPVSSLLCLLGGNKFADRLLTFRRRKVIQDHFLSLRVARYKVTILFMGSIVITHPEFLRGFGWDAG